MKNFIEDGKTINYTVVDAPIKGGDVRMIGDVAAIAVTDGEVGDTIAMYVSGVYELPKVSGVITQGQKVYVNVTEGVTAIAGTATGNKFAGWAWETSTAAAITVLVKLHE